ncbi:MAG: DNA-binding response regulator [Polaromonas sp. 39-63-203]|jgi:two-component system response regulator AlgR|uniref:LytR/AlgR family response regulator transcription factor n=1 Tax=Polaromonas sp. TaxID=1869339 RepID=UPI000BCE4C4D|nr:LytTR family DNA-binding domain-containing protein [Polaromonas sp.]OYY53407.1 MAG: DNA-binding response regulator [Polaromonas sp. 35-63-240]OYZ00191.1 MAG: DNA-binding response regulator [Polaromonas sp. 28-63-22]OYZ84466.1 MAG: DNA-binding response regulator [Polaromonas sp. 24-62-144]OZB00127.1 MAG: DNA-binding response regulator [Polaromonas sp. 39-63-203]HQS30451.1 LytTR family DNA-binding domain-containing protein [Polaromonas sp.]
MKLRVLLVDDEALARSRLTTLLGDCVAPSAVVATEAADAVQAMRALKLGTFDVVLLDIRMPGMDGVTLAKTIAALPQPPAVVFVTAHAEHAVQAFEIEAIDYLTKPVRLERLQQALQKVERLAQVNKGPGADSTEEILIIQDRGRTERVPLSEVLYLKAELKYVTVRTAVRSYILDGSLSELEEKHAAYFMRIHRNALIARRAVRALERHFDAEEGEGWAVRLNGIDELLAVSRRQLSAVREAIAT